MSQKGVNREISGVEKRLIPENHLTESIRCFFVFIYFCFSSVVLPCSHGRVFPGREVPSFFQVYLSLIVRRFEGATPRSLWGLDLYFIAFAFILATPHLVVTYSMEVITSLAL
ncbi:hypothetical protein P170DRAFT_111785 [Aspergillus steynii IBT 23096]|uniref:Uncharacterized protein n=1 Tax=Aspergillus steynii IBT 23096 TaxID=1392250 RepID=A0A2I2GIU4_9EURO|nr:uncharacterized protein P170DRAFT_111785 [Aspergillus steynii IBT 23096]PLB52757.1 hypothetical protein P170DRAFT_111785 [Aspergillus steynii IBT 23096]